MKKHAKHEEKLYPLIFDIHLNQKATFKLGTQKTFLITSDDYLFAGAILLACLYHSESVAASSSQPLVSSLSLVSTHA